MKSNIIPVSPKIIEYLSGIYDPDWVRSYCEYAHSEITDYIRVNTLKTSAEFLAPRLREKHGITLTPIDGCPEAYRADDPNRTLGKTIEHITGMYYIQSLSSMLPALVLEPQPGEKILDLCAAPGSKSTFIAARMNNSGVLISNEMSPNRAGVLSFNLERMGIINAGVHSIAGEWLSPAYPEYFDRILVDAPCTGLGIVQKKGEVSNWWSKEHAAKLAHQQYRLLNAAVKMLKPGGRMVYSTCTLTIEENEAVIDLLLKKSPVELERINLPVKSSSAFTSLNEQTFSPALMNARRITPWEINSEGFFIASFKKTAPLSPAPEFNGKMFNRFRVAPQSTVVKIADHFSERFEIDRTAFANYKIIEKSSDYYLISSDWDDELLALHNHAGMKIGAFDKYKNFIMHSNAVRFFADQIRKNIFFLQDEHQFKRYLDGGTIKWDAGLSRGSVAVGFHGMVIGSAVASNDTIKSQLPRNYRSQGIII